MGKITEPEVAQPITMDDIFDACNKIQAQQYKPNFIFLHKDLWDLMQYNNNRVGQLEFHFVRDELHDKQG